MIYEDCKYFTGDDDCIRCEKRGYFYGGCEYCTYYDDGTIIKKKEENE